MLCIYYRHVYYYICYTVFTNLFAHPNSWKLFWGSSQKIAHVTKVIWINLQWNLYGYEFKTEFPQRNRAKSTSSFINKVKYLQRRKHLHHFFHNHGWCNLSTSYRFNKAALVYHSHHPPVKQKWWWKWVHQQTILIQKTQEQHCRHSDDYLIMSVQEKLLCSKLPTVLLSFFSMSSYNETFIIIHTHLAITHLLLCKKMCICGYCCLICYHSSCNN